MKRLPHWHSVLLATIVLLIPCVLRGNDLVADRPFDRLWQAYRPTLHHHFGQYLALDDATLDALAAGPATSVRLRLRLDRHGRIHTVEVLEPSPVPEFTAACATAARQMGQLPALPTVIREHGYRHGLEFTFGTFRGAHVAPPTGKAHWVPPLSRAVRAGPWGPTAQ
ncbi:MAG: energy transducer TonB [Deltaproteobacteria bacterium]|nr:energy transducer TonB [Deltaproteobacteria bacterium]